MLRARTKSWFEPNLVTACNSAEHPENVDSNVDNSEQEAKQNQTLELEEPKTPASESMIFHVMPSISSKKKQAASQMYKAMMASIVKGGIANNDTTIFFSGDFCVVCSPADS